ncbi:hypothetical protein EJ110_NYTH02957 [Nymphaea thermarum]|nr:hypothetical protein EJ110_NYTH02957 [Nymphaea thermarum]
MQQKLQVVVAVRSPTEGELTLAEQEEEYLRDEWVGLMATTTIQQKPEVIGGNGVARWEEQHSFNGKFPNCSKNSNEIVSNGSISGGYCGNMDDSESNEVVRRLVRNGQLPEALTVLENMAGNGEMPDIIPCTSLIRGFCKMGQTKKATKVLDIIDGSGAQYDPQELM